MIVIAPGSGPSERDSGESSRGHPINGGALPIERYTLSIGSSSAYLPLALVPASEQPPLRLV
jgi:hypothetical protein